jgi:hypothetical protein
VIAAGDLLNTRMAFGAVTKIAGLEPIAHLFIDHVFALAVLVLAPLAKTSSAKLMITMDA